MKKHFIRLLTAVCCIWAVDAYAKINLEPPPDIPPGINSRDFKELTATREILLKQYNETQQQIDKQAERCHSVEKGSPKATECAAEAQEVKSAVRDYRAALERFKTRLAAVTAEKSAMCNAAASQAEKDRAEIERLMQNIESSREELQEWTRMNNEAKKKALEASIQFIAGEYVANIDKVSKSVSKLESHALALAKKAAKSRKYETRMKYLAEMKETVSQLVPNEMDLAAKVVVKIGADTQEAWDVARDTMHQEFRVASKHNQAIREILKEPEFKEAFIGDDIDSPGTDTISALAEKASEELGESALGLEKYAKFTGPSVRAAVFVRDSAYSALLSLYSTARVQQQNDLAGGLAKATGVLQKQYKKSIDALRACQQTNSDALESDRR